MGYQMSCNTHWTSTRTATTVRSREGLVEIQVKHIKAHIARTDNTHERVHIRSVIVKQTAAFMNQGCNFKNFLFEESKSVRIGHHDTCNRVIEKRLEVLHIHQTGSIGLHLNDFKAADSSRCRIGSMRAVRHDDAGSLSIAA